MCQGGPASLILPVTHLIFAEHNGKCDLTLEMKAAVYGKETDLLFWR